ncbi:DUF3081 domain-containing protein [Aliiglaciecola sp. CAU 1673]|uniref:DUF3081 domain-containing protein n=1 Tax=Aliiglaciecola sp. CAU 1673 TaxID=3032595 RepID=UPI0023D9DE17|nr:DUF3081 domain-containing protein [Aliiglaciecola sp. CAU 1673]MDF2180045.1 DUF3081 domain-containing protein [Aliiglaciecola sp. CAU 1673]
MKNELDSKFVLAVFEKIRLLGEKTEEGHVLEGVTAWTDFDGYTVYLQDHQVQLSWGFHNQYHYQYDNAEQLEQFLTRLRHINHTY